MTLSHKFVTTIPSRDQLENGVIYISMDFATAIHKCVCGCGNEVVTPFTPTGWKLTFNGKTVTLSPSIGNWSFPCQSHYWIRHNQIKWALKWPPEETEPGRLDDVRPRSKKSFWENFKWGSRH